MMTFADLRKLVWYWVDDQQGISTGTGGYFTNTQVNVFLNNAQREVQKQLLQAGEMFYLKVVETATVKDQQDYVLPLDFLKLHRLELVVSGYNTPNEEKNMMQRVTLNQSDMIAGGIQFPVAYTMKKDRFSLYPIPTVMGKTIRLYYSYFVVDMTSDAEEPDVPPEYAEYIAILAAEQCLLKDDRQSPQLMELKKSYLDMLKQTSEDRAEDSSRQVIVTRDDSFGSMF